MIPSPTFPLRSSGFDTILKNNNAQIDLSSHRLYLAQRVNLPSADIQVVGSGRKRVMR